MFKHEGLVRRIASVMPIKYPRLGWPCLLLLWSAGALVMTSRMMAGEPTINLIGYIGGLLFATYVVLNVLRRDAELQDWAMLFGMVLLMVYGWLADFSPGEAPTFSMGVAAAIVLLLGIIVAVKMNDAAGRVGSAIQGWVQAHFGKKGSEAKGLGEDL